MKKAKLSTREIVMMVFLVILLVAVGYYMFFLTPLDEELASIQAEITDIETQKQSHTEKLSLMNSMERELADLKANRPADELSEVAVYDNTVEVLNALNQYLEVNTISHSLTFVTPEVGEDGTVRRVVQMAFECIDYASAREIINDLTGNKWRCLVSNTTISTVDENLDLTTGLVAVQLDITFFEISNAPADASAE